MFNFFFHHDSWGPSERIVMDGEANAKRFVSLSLLDGEFVKTFSNFCLCCSTNMKQIVICAFNGSQNICYNYKRPSDHSKLCFVSLFYDEDNDDDDDDDD